MKQFDSEDNGIQLPEDYKPTYIAEQHNNNCQQFFGPITNCTFTMPPAKTKSQSKQKTKKQSKTIAALEKPKTLKYFKHGDKKILLKQEERVAIVFNKFNKWGWIDSETSSDDFDSFFNGEPRFCNISWKANTTILTILLQELLKKDYIGSQTNCSAKSLVKEQFHKTANSDRTRISNDDYEHIQITLILLDIKNPLPFKYDNSGEEEEIDTSDITLKEVYSGILRSTKGI